MEGEKKKINTGETGFYQQVISESKKVTNMVGTFSNEHRYGFQEPVIKVKFGKGYQYGGNLFERAKRWHPSTRHKSGVGKGYQYGGNLFKSRLSQQLKLVDRIIVL